MFLKPLVTTGVKNLLNTFLYRSPALKSIRTRLQEKVLHVDLKGFSTPLALVSSERQADVLGAQEGEADCTIITYANVLSKLRDRQQLTTLIRSGELKVQGDTQVIQNLVTLADLMELDPVEPLVPYTDDIVAEGVNEVLYDGTRFLCHNLQHQQRYAVEATTEEWRMVPSPLEVAWFAEETAAVKRTVESLAKRLEKLEAK